MKKFVPRTGFFHKEKYMQKENNFLLHNPRIGTYFTALSGERNKFPARAPLIVCLY